MGALVILLIGSVWMTSWMLLGRYAPRASRWFAIFAAVIIAAFTLDALAVHPSWFFTGDWVWW